MDLSKLSLDPQQKETVETILADDDMEFQEKLMNLTSLQLDIDSYVKIKAYLTKKEMDKIKQKVAADFVPLIEEAKQTLVLFYLKQKKYDVIAKEVAKQSPECQQAFREFMKQKGLNVPTMEVTSFFNSHRLQYEQTKIVCQPTVEVEDENEDTTDGQSSAQSPKAYQLEWGPSGNRKIIRLIDTPGVNDVRGMDQEAMNFAKILSFIADYPKMDLSKLSLDPQQKEIVETILADDDMEFQEKLMNLTSLQLDIDSYVKIKAYLTKKDEAEMDKKKQKVADFVPLIEEAKQTLVLFYLKRKKYDVIAKEVAKQSPECQQAFREFMKQKGLNVPTMEKQKAAAET